MKSHLFILIALISFSCKKTVSNKETTNDSSIDTSATSTKDFREFKVLDSKFIDIETLWLPFEKYWEEFTEKEYEALRPLILEQDIPALQMHIAEGDLSYEQLILFYLYRIKKFDRNNERSLNSVISLNANVVEKAKKADNTDFEVAPHPIFGMPILLKDNINVQGMPTTAGAIALQNNFTDDAFIVKRLKSHGALILGKTNLSEWAYFFCGDCPSGYSAIGGQTLNPYGRKIIDTGGSSSGSGVAAAVNFAVATVGTETSGSILSPASQNSVVGLKPTVGLLSRTGIVPISSTLDTPGPITKNVIDNAIMLDAMYGYDKEDFKSILIKREKEFSYFKDLTNDILKEKRFGVFKSFLKEPLYANAVQVLINEGVEIIEIEEDEVGINGFLTLLNIDMRNDLPNYLKNHDSKNVKVSSVAEVISFNKKDSINRCLTGKNYFMELLMIKRLKKNFNKSRILCKSKERSFLMFIWRSTI